MATNYYAKKFASTTEVAEFLNFGAATLKESGTGFISGTNLFTAVTATNFSDFQDIDGSGTNLSGFLILSGQVAGEQFTSFATSAVASANTINLSSMTNIGTPSAPVSYRIYSAVGTFPGSGSIEILTQVDSGFLLVWKNAAPVHFS